MNYVRNITLILSIFFISKISTYAKEKIKSKEQLKTQQQKFKDEKEARREKKLAEVIENILQSFEFGTPTEIFNSLAIVKRVKSKKDLDKIRPGLIKLFDSERFQVLAVLIKTLTLGKIDGFEQQVIKILSDEKKSQNEGIIKAIISYCQEFKPQLATKPLMKIFASRDLSKNNNTTLSFIHILGSLKYDIYAQYVLNTLEHEYPELLSANIIKSKVKINTTKKQKNKIAKETNASSFWNKEEDQKLDVSLQSEMILSLGKIRYVAGGPFLVKFIKAGFKDADITNEKFKSLPDLEIPIVLQAHAINSLGEIEYREAIPWLKYKVSHYKSLNDSDKKRYFSLYLQSIAALAKMKDPSGEKILIKSMRDNSSTVRFRSAKLLSFMRSAKAAKILAYRALRDSNSKVGFQCLSALMEMIEPGSTTGGIVKGSKGSASAVEAAREGLYTFLDVKKNPVPRYRWFRFMAQNLTDEGVLNKIVDYILKKTDSFLTKEKQIYMVSTLTSIVKHYFKKKKIIHTRAKFAIIKLSNQSRHRIAARRAAKSLRYIKSLK